MYEESLQYIFKTIQILRSKPILPLPSVMCWCSLEFYFLFGNSFGRWTGFPWKKKSSSTMLSVLWRGCGHVHKTTTTKMEI